MRNKLGYTLVELLIIITITAMLMTFIFSGYTRSQERQAREQAKEVLLSKLSEYQKAAYVGDKDCTGTLVGIEITFTANSLTGTAHCSNGSTGTPQVSSFPSLTFNPTPSAFTFRPLEQGISFASGSSQNIDYVIEGITYRITVSNPGTIMYVGKVAP